MDHVFFPLALNPSPRGRPKVLLVGDTGSPSTSLLPPFLTHLLTSPLHTYHIGLLTFASTPHLDTLRTTPRLPNIHIHTAHSLDDTPAITTAASQHDVVVQCTPAAHLGSVRSIIRGLAMRKARMREEVYFIGGDGVASLGGGRRVYEGGDGEGDVFARLRAGEGARAATVAAVEMARAEGVRCTVVVSPIVYGGEGWFERERKSLAEMSGGFKQGEDQDGDDKTRECGFVHVEDLVELYGLLVLDFVSGRRAAPVGERGIVFSGTGSFTWEEAVGWMSVDGLRDGEDRRMDGVREMLERAFASNVGMRSEVAKEVLKWRPRKTKGDWKKALREELEKMGGQV